MVERGTWTHSGRDGGRCWVRVRYWDLPCSVVPERSWRGGTGFDWGPERTSAFDTLGEWGLTDEDDMTRFRERELIGVKWSIGGG